MLLQRRPYFLLSVALLGSKELRPQEKNGKNILHKFAFFTEGEQPGAGFHATPGKN